MTNDDIAKLVNGYIGVSGGYLGDFTYASHEEFYPAFCGLYYDTKSMPGTTRQRFVDILKKASRKEKAQIIRGTLKKYPVSFFPEDIRAGKQKFYNYFMALANRLDGSGGVPLPQKLTASEVVTHALFDAETLLRDRGATSGVDRVHTVLHGYAREVCREAGLTSAADASLPKLFSTIYTDHPAFGDATPHGRQVRKVIRSLAGSIDAVNVLRNNATPAHPNEELLAEPEARLVLNAASALLHYVEARLDDWRSSRRLVAPDPWDAPF